MRTAGLTATVALLGLVAVGASASAPQSPGASARQATPTAKPAAAKPNALPRTPDGRPDLQGNWTNATITPLERQRPDTPLVLTEEAARLDETNTAGGARSARRAERSESHRAAGWWCDSQEPERRTVLPRTAVARRAAARSAATTRSGSTRATRCCGWTDSRAARSSSIRRPAGCPATPTRRARGWRRRPRSARSQGSEFDHPELRPLAERCITSFGNNAGPPMLPNYFYNNSYTIVQSKDTVDDPHRDGARRARDPHERHASARGRCASGSATRSAAGKATRW